MPSPKHRLCIRHSAFRNSHSAIPHALPLQHARRSARDARRDWRRERSTSCSTPIPDDLKLGRPLDLPPALSEMELDQHLRQLAARQSARRAEGLLPRRRQLRPLRAGGVRRDRLAQRVLHLVHAVPGRGEPGQPAGDVRVPVAHHAADRHGRGQLEPVRRRQRRGRGGADGPARRRQAQRRSSCRRACIPSIGRRSPRIWRTSTPKS